MKLEINDPVGTILVLDGQEYKICKRCDFVIDKVRVFYKDHRGNPCVMAKEYDSCYFKVFTEDNIILESFEYKSVKSVTVCEGGHWISFRCIDLPQRIHAVEMKDRREWDCVNGWRT